MKASLIGEYMGRKGECVEPEVGMAATYFIGSDRYPMVVTAVINKRKICIAHMDKSDYENFLVTDENNIQRIAASRIDDYIAHANDTVYTKRKNGRWVPEGESLWAPGGIEIGTADYYLDPCF